MSTMSTVTTSAAQDHTLGNESELLNHMCVLVVAKGNSTPFDTTSIQDEDIIELCVKVRHMHPEGVLWLLVTELVIYF